MSSPYLNNLIIVGCLLSYTSIYFLGEYDGFFFKYICVVTFNFVTVFYKVKLNTLLSLFLNLIEIRLWLLTVGFTLAFGAMFSKTYRVHAILTNSKLTKKVCLF